MMKMKLLEEKLEKETPKRRGIRNSIYAGVLSLILAATPIISRAEEPVYTGDTKYPGPGGYDPNNKRTPAVVFTPEVKFEPKYEGMSPEEILEAISTPEKVLEYWQNNIRYYDPDPNAPAHCQPPEKTIHLGYGQCDDTARLVVEALNRNPNINYNAFMFTIGFDIIPNEDRSNIYGTESIQGGRYYSWHSVGAFVDEDGKFRYIQGNKGEWEIKISEGYDTLEDMARGLIESSKYSEYYRLLNNHIFAESIEEFLKNVFGQDY